MSRKTDGDTRKRRRPLACPDVVHIYIGGFSDSVLFAIGTPVAPKRHSEGAPATEELRVPDGRAC